MRNVIFDGCSLLRMDLEPHSYNRWPAVWSRFALSSIGTPVRGRLCEFAVVRHKSPRAFLRALFRYCRLSRFLLISLLERRLRPNAAHRINFVRQAHSRTLWASNAAGSYERSTEGPRCKHFGKI